MPQSPIPILRPLYLYDFGHTKPLNPNIRVVHDVSERQRESFSEGEIMPEVVLEVLGFRVLGCFSF